MEQSNTTTEAPEPQVVTNELVRPREGRMVAGVAQGLANRFNFPVVLIRVVFALLTFGGGLGIALYAAGWFLIRSEDEAEAPAAGFFSGASGGRSWIGIGLVFIAALILLDNFTFLSGGIVWAVALLVVGILLYTGDLPRLVQQSDDKEGVQQVTTPSAPAPPTTETVAPAGSAPAPPTTETVAPAGSAPAPPTTETVAPAGSAPAPPSAETVAPAGGAPVTGGPPPTPTPTPPILPPAAAKPKESSFLGRLTIGLILVSLGVLAILDNIPGIPIEPELRHYMALGVTILGLGLMVGGFIGRARWLILVGVIMVPTMLFSPVFEYDWSSENFDLDETPQSFDELENSYSLDVGNIEIDLRELPWDGETVDLEVTIDAGNIEIVIPDGVGLTGEASLAVGQVTAPGRATAGFGSPGLVFNEPGPLGTVNLDANVDLGNISIIAD